MKRMLFVYNPHAGRALLRTKLSDVVDIFVKAGYKVTVHPTQSFRDAYHVVREYEADDYDIVVCSGGDGTLDEVVAAMMKRDIGQRDIVGYIPTGSTNDFANSLHIPKNLLQAADVAVNGAPFPCDIGCFNDDSFVYIAAFGLFTDVSYETNQEMKNMIGHLAYIFEGAKRIFNIPAYKMKVEYDGNVLEDEFAYGMITNSKSVGGFKNIIGKDVAFDDGLFEVTLIKRPRNPIELQEIASSLLIEQLDTKHMCTFRTSKMTITSEEEIPWTLDGEFGGNHQDVKIVNLKQQLTIMVPKEKIDKLLSKKHNI